MVSQASIKILCGFIGLHGRGFYDDSVMVRFTTVVQGFAPRECEDLSFWCGLQHVGLPTCLPAKPPIPVPNKCAKSLE